MRAAAACYLLLMVALPVGIVARSGFSAGLGGLARALWHPVARSALLLTLQSAAIMALINAVMGTLIAYVLVRYQFPGRRILNLLIDLPFAIPTLVAGLMLVVLLGPSAPLGRALDGAGLRVVYAPASILLCLLFVTLPFVVRAVEPVLRELDPAEEEAARILGASDVAAFRRVILPSLSPAIVSGSLLSFSRALGEFGSIVVVAGNIPRRTLTAAVFVFGEVESGNPLAASAMALVLITISFSILLLVDAFGRRAAHA
ncbi:ABC transporter permease [Chondromyces crocatus]|nr:sulfate ABC transporter permease subunit [Chondromyces crocatus]